MGILRLAGSMVKSVVDVKTWIGYDQLKRTTKGLVGTIKPMYAVRKATFQETFEEALTRLNIAEIDLPHIVYRYKKSMYLFLFFALFAALYLVYLIFKLHLLASFIALFIVVLFLVKAAESHFYIFQIKNRKLGCTIKEWLDGKITRE